MTIWEVWCPWLGEGRVRCWKAFMRGGKLGHHFHGLPTTDHSRRRKDAYYAHTIPTMYVCMSEEQSDTEL